MKYVVVQEHEVKSLNRRGYVLTSAKLEADEFYGIVANMPISAITLSTAELLEDQFGITAEVIDPAELFPGQRLLFWGERVGRDYYLELEVVSVP